MVPTVCGLTGGQEILCPTGRRTDQQDSNLLIGFVLIDIVLIIDSPVVIPKCWNVIFEAAWSHVKPLVIVFHAFVSIHLNYYKSLLTGLPQKSINCLQLALQNTPAGGFYRILKNMSTSRLILVSSWFLELIWNCCYLFLKPWLAVCSYTQHWWGSAESLTILWEIPDPDYSHKWNLNDRIAVSGNIKHSKTKLTRETSS